MRLVKSSGQCSLRSEIPFLPEHTPEKLSSCVPSILSDQRGPRDPSVSHPEQGQAIALSDRASCLADSDSRDPCSVGGASAEKRPISNTDRLTPNLVQTIRRASCRPQYSLIPRASRRLAKSHSRSVSSSPCRPFFGPASSRPQSSCCS